MSGVNGDVLAPCMCTSLLERQRASPVHHLMYDNYYFSELLPCMIITTLFCRSRYMLDSWRSFRVFWVRRPAQWGWVMSSESCLVSHSTMTGPELCTTIPLPARYIAAVCAPHIACSYVKVLQNAGGSHLSLSLGWQTSGIHTTLVWKPRPLDVAPLCLPQQPHV